LFAYHLSDGLPAGNPTVWSQLSLQPLAAQPLTPFSYSTLEEVAKSAWYQYFDELGFDPMPRAQVLRQHEGRAYLNLTLSAQRDAEQAAIEPLTLQVNGEPFALAKWEKPGLLAGLKMSRKRKKVEQLLENYRQQMSAVTQKAESWYHKTQELRWTQADILQVMEEIERVGIASFKIFLAARHNLELGYNRLLWATQRAQPFPTNVALIQAALGELDGLVEGAIAKDLLALGETAAKNQATVAWLQARDYTDWQSTLPNQGLVTAIETFLGHYGHRCTAEGEISHTRWQQDPSPLFAALLVHVQSAAKTPEKRAATQSIEPLLDRVTPDQRKSVQAQVQSLRHLLILQSQAVHAFAYILAGTRRWALAAAKEAQADQRVRQTEEVFFFHLEEVKQMMTGEWNISSRQAIHTTCDERKMTYAHWDGQWRNEGGPTLLLGDTAAYPIPQSIPGAKDKATDLVHFYHSYSF
jgi:hypothetical protein